MGGTGRKKRQKKSMTFYRVAFGLTPPYPVVMHPEFVRQCVKARVNLKDQLPKVMQDKAYPVVTRCIVEALRRSNDTGCAVLARQFQRVPCTHTKVQQLAGKERKGSKAPHDDHDDDDDDDDEEHTGNGAGQAESGRDRKGREVVPIVRPGTCIRSLLESKVGKGMAVAVAGDTSESLRRKELPQVPFLFFVPPTSVMLLPPCTDAQAKTHKRDKEKRDVGKKEKKAIKKLERDNALPPRVLGKRKRQREPNPLSCRKSKSSTEREKEPAPPPEKKKRNRRRTKKKSAPSTEEADT